MVFRSLTSDSSILNIDTKTIHSENPEEGRNASKLVEEVRLLRVRFIFIGIKAGKLGILKQEKLPFYFHICDIICNI